MSIWKTNWPKYEIQNKGLEYMSAILLVFWDLYNSKIIGLVNNDNKLIYMTHNIKGFE